MWHAMLGDAGSVPSATSVPAVAPKTTKLPRDHASAKSKPRPGARATSRGACETSAGARPEAVKARSTSTPPAKPRASPVGGNPRKDLSGEFAKAASDNAAGALMASPQIKSPFHKKIKLDDHLEP